MRTSEGLTRLLTFIDAVVAIAVTLLVLPLVDLAQEFREDETLTDLLHHNDGKIFAFLLSFAVIARLWWAHHQTFERVERYDGVVVFFSLLWAFTIVTLPFPTQLVAVHGSDLPTRGLYLGLLLLSSVCLSALSVRVSKKPELHREGAAGRSSIEAFTATFWIAVATVVALLIPSTGYWGLFLLLLSGPSIRLWHRFHRTSRSS